MLRKLLIIVLATVVLQGNYLPKIFNIELHDVGKNNYFAKQIISNGIAGEPVKEKEKKGRSIKFKSKKHKAGEKGSDAGEKGEEQEWGTVVSVLASKAAKTAAVAAAKEVCKAAVGADYTDDQSQKEGKNAKKNKKKKKEEKKEVKKSYTKRVKKTLKRMETELAGWKKWAKTHLKGFSKVAKKATISAARAACKSIGS